MIFAAGVVTGLLGAFALIAVVGLKYKRDVRIHLDQLDSKQRAAKYAEDRLAAAALPAQAVARQRAAHRQPTGSTPAVPPAAS